MRLEFKKYLIERGYKEITPSGNPSTVYDYLKRIDKVCEWENVSSFQELAGIIDIVEPKYEEGGEKAVLGRKSHNAVVCALRCFRTFVFENSDKW